MAESKVESNRQVLAEAQSRGKFATLGAYVKLSGPGWLQSAITLGGGSLAGALYLGILAGTHMLWLQLVAIVIGVIMLSAISYVTLSTGKHPYRAINEYINPVLGVGWVAATILANMIWIMPQYSLCFDSLQTSLFNLSDDQLTKIIVSAVVGVLAFVIVAMSLNPGTMLRAFDTILKLIIAFVIICFVFVAILLFRSGAVDFSQVLYGFIPDISHWKETSPDVQVVMADMAADARAYWREKILQSQRSNMISVTATAVGLNMTFLLPYSMLARRWDKTFRGLARFDLVTGMAIPFILVTSCIVIASAHAFHVKPDQEFLSSEPSEVKQSIFFSTSLSLLQGRYAETEDNEAAIQELESLAASDSDEDRARYRDILAQYATTLGSDERTVIATLNQPTTRQLAQSLSPLLGKRNAHLVFGAGALAMGFSTIIILMMINGYAAAEIMGRFDSRVWRLAGALAAGIIGFFWWYIWADKSETWLSIVASTFAAILLPIAYVAFFALMNSRSLLQEARPRGARMWIWNILMAIGVLGALIQAISSVWTKVQQPETGSFVIGCVATFLLLAAIGFSARFRRIESTPSAATSPRPNERGNEIDEQGTR